MPPCPAPRLPVISRSSRTRCWHSAFPLTRGAFECASAATEPASSGEGAVRSARAGRGSRKDFVDLYVYTREVSPLEQTFARFREKYGAVSFDPYHLVRDLTFFEDAEAEPMPEILVPVAWDQVTAFFRAEAARLFRALPPAPDP